MQVVLFTTGYAEEFGQRVTSFITEDTAKKEIELHGFGSISIDTIISMSFDEIDEKVASIIYNVPGIQIYDDGVLKEVNTLKLKRAISEALETEGFLLAEIYPVK